MQFTDGNHQHMRYDMQCPDGITRTCSWSTPPQLKLQPTKAPPTTPPQGQYTPHQLATPCCSQLIASCIKLAHTRPHTTRLAAALDTTPQGHTLPEAADLQLYRHTKWAVQCSTSCSQQGPGGHAGPALPHPATSQPAGAHRTFGMLPALAWPKLALTCSQFTTFHQALM